MKAGERPWPQLISLVSAPLLWLAYPGGGDCWPLLALALVPLFLCLTRMSGPQAFGAGLAFGTLHYLLQLYWIVTVLGHYGGLPSSLAVLALLLLTGYMAVYIAGFALMARALLLGGSSLVALVAIPALWVGGDWLRGWLFSGFPWMDIGYALAYQPWAIQLAELFGHGSVSYLLVLLNTLLTLVFLHRGRPRRLGSPLVLSALLFAAVALYSGWRWQDLTKTMASPATAHMAVGIVQGNIDQDVKWSPENQQRTLTTYIRSSQALWQAERPPELIVWPETALPFYPQVSAGLAPLTRLVARFDAPILTGAPWFEATGPERKDIRYYNSAQLLAPDGLFVASYYKSHLVPFGEYVPLRKFLPFLSPLVEAVGDFTPGQVERPLVWRESRIGVLICFESIFADISRKWSQSGANLLVNLTNDAWYGKSSAPHHSMAMTIFRAVETRRSIVRSANTGISGFIDPLGRLDDPSPLFVTWAKARSVVLLDGQSVFVRWGYLFPRCCLLVGLALTLTATAGRRGTTNR
ncbi:MAG: apolipoprotein N-acyltransferase [Desulfopila sp.]